MITSRRPPLIARFEVSPQVRDAIRARATTEPRYGATLWPLADQLFGFPVEVVDDPMRLTPGTWRALGAAGDVIAAGGLIAGAD